MPQWESLYFHRSKQLLLGVYVDDFHMAGEKENLAPMWNEMDKIGLKLDPSCDFNNNTYLGCTQHDVEIPPALIQKKRLLFKQIMKQISATTQCEIEELAKEAETPPKARGYEYKMNGAAEGCVLRYLELSGLSRGSLRPVATPCIEDTMIPPEDFVSKGELSASASKIVL